MNLRSIPAIFSTLIVLAPAVVHAQDNAPSEFGGYCCIDDQTQSPDCMFDAKFTDEDRCLFNSEDPSQGHGYERPDLGIWAGLRSAFPDGTAYAGLRANTPASHLEAYDKCKFFCRPAQPYFYCVNWKRRSNDEPAACDLIPSTIEDDASADPQNEQLQSLLETFKNKRGYIRQDHCLNTCPPNTCRSCEDGSMEDAARYMLGLPGRTDDQELSEDEQEEIDDIVETMCTQNTHCSWTGNQCEQKEECRHQLVGCCFRGNFSPDGDHNDPTNDVVYYAGYTDGYQPEEGGVITRLLAEGNPSRPRTLQWRGNEQDNDVESRCEGETDEIDPEDLAESANACDLRYYSCCSSIAVGFGDGETLPKGLYLAERNNSPLPRAMLNGGITVPGMGTIGDVRDIAYEMTYEELDECYDESGLETGITLLSHGPMTERGYGALDIAGQECRQTSSESSASSEPLSQPPGLCEQCAAARNDEAACEAIHAEFGEGFCEWSGGECVITEGGYCAESSSSAPVVADEFNLCDRRVNGNANVSLNERRTCMKYPRGAPPPPIRSRNGDNWGNRTQFLQQTVTTFGTGDEGLNACTALCRKVLDQDLYGVCGHRAGNVKQCLYQSLSFCRDNRDLTFPVDVNGENVDCQVWARS